MKLSTKNADSNYLARVIKLPEPVKHPNADKLFCVSILNNNVITTNPQAGQLYVYFPLETAINKDFLSWSNSFSNPEKNADQNKKGFFDSAGRVRALKLRGEKSEGYIVPAKDINTWLGTEAITTQDVNKDFDSIGEVLICEKYVVGLSTEQKEQRPNKKLTILERIFGRRQQKSFNKLIPGNFALSVSTANLKKEIGSITPETLVTVAYKLHGCNAVIANVKCKKKLSFIDKGLKLLGFNIVEEDYDIVYASRNTIKNSTDRSFVASNDLWKSIADRYQGCISKGISVYGEIVGYYPNGKAVQKDYDYWQKPGEADFFVYRITSNDGHGNVTEYTTKEIQAYCDYVGLKTVPIFNNCLAKDIFPDLPVDENWQSNFLKRLQAKYNEKDCFICKNKVPEEGVVLIQNSDNKFKALKLKSFRFLEKETKALDAGEVNTEDT